MPYNPETFLAIARTKGIAAARTYKASFTTVTAAPTTSVQQEQRDPYGERSRPAPAPYVPPAPPFQEPSRPGAPPAPPAPPAYDSRLLQAGRGTNRAPEPVDPSSFAPALALLAQSPGAGAVFASLQNAPLAPQFLGPGAAQAARFQGVSPNEIIPQVSINQLSVDNPPAMGAFLQLIGDTAAGALGGALDVGFAQANINAERDQNFIQEAADLAGAFFAGGVAGGIDAAQASLQESITGIDPAQQTINLGGPASDKEWWEVEGGLGLYRFMRMQMQGGIIPQTFNLTMQQQFGYTNQEMIDRGYVFDENTNMWVFVPGEDLGDAQAGLGGGGYYPSGGGGGGGFNFTYPTPARSAQGLGLTNWRI